MADAFTARDLRGRICAMHRVNAVLADALAQGRPFVEVREQLRGALDPPATAQSGRAISRTRARKLAKGALP